MSSVDQDLFGKLKKHIVETLEVDEGRITMEASLKALGVDELDMHELAYALESELGISIPDEKANEFKTVGDIYEFIRPRNDSQDDALEQFKMHMESFNENKKAFTCKGEGTNVDDKLIEQALGYMVEKNFEKAIPLFEDAANQGHMGAQYALGELYYYGNVDGYSFTSHEGELKADKAGMKKAIYWFKEAAEQNHPDAESFLGTIFYDDDWRVARNKTKAKYWYKRAYKHGSDVAFRNLYKNNLSFSDPLLTFLSIVVGIVVGGFAASMFGFFGFVGGFVIGCIIMRVLRTG